VTDVFFSFASALILLSSAVLFLFCLAECYFSLEALLLMLMIWQHESFSPGKTKLRNKGLHFYIYMFGLLIVPIALVSQELSFGPNIIVLDDKVSKSVFLLLYFEYASLNIS